MCRYLPKNFSLYSQISHERLEKPLFMSNSISPENVPSAWGQQTFNELRNLGLRPGSSCYFSIRSKSNNYWDYVVDWISSYIQPALEGREQLYVSPLPTHSLSLSIFAERSKRTRKIAKEGAK